MEEVPSQTEFEENNILFLDDKDWPKNLFEKVLLK
jgi:hypothetical protein